MRVIDVRGYIVPDEDVRFYRFFGYSVVCPRDVLGELKKAGKEPVTVRVNSYGGDVWSASEIYTALMQHEPGVEVEITGLAASAATVIMMAGRKVRASPTAEIMIHNPYAAARGDYRAMEHAAQSLRNTRETIVNAYVIRSGNTREQLRLMMDAETWMTAQGAKANGIIDEIMFVSEETLGGATEETAATTGAGMKAAAIEMPSAEALRAKWSVYRELAPSAKSVEEARAMIAGRFVKNETGEGRIQKKPDEEPKPAQEAETDNERFNFLLEQIKVMGM